MAKFKKPKKKVRKIRSKGKLLTTDDLKPDNAGIEKIGSRRPKIKNETDYDIDDVPCKCRLAVIITKSVIQLRYYILAIETPTEIKFEDEKDDLLEKALHKARKIKQKENVVAEIVKTELKDEPEDQLDGGNIVLNATAEFCRTLGQYNCS